MKKVLILTTVLALISGASHAQYSKQSIKEAKGVALCQCLEDLNIATDSLSAIRKDVSIFYFTEYARLSPEQIMSIEKFVDQNIDSFSVVPREAGANMIGYTCWKLYESDTLDLFIKKMLRKNNTKN